MGDDGKKGKRLVNEPCMNDPWTWTMVWGLIVGAEGGRDEGKQSGENWENCKRINKIKNK